MKNDFRLIIIINFVFVEQKNEKKCTLKLGFSAPIIPFQIDIIDTSAMKFLFDRRSAEFLFESGFSRGVQHFLSDRSTVGGPRN